MEIDEFKAARDRSRALEAHALMENSMLKEAFEQLEAGYIDAWKKTRPDDQIGREKLYLAANVIGKVRDHLERTMANGRVAENDLYQLALRRKHHVS